MTVTQTRRTFLQTTTATAAAALIIGFAPNGALASTVMEGGNFSPFVKIMPDGKVIAISKHAELGQGTATGLATLIAEELGAKWEEVEVAFAPSNPAVYSHSNFPGLQATGGSNAISSAFIQYRSAGAAARVMLLTAAANAWGVEASTLTLKDSVISGGGKSAPLADFVVAAAALPVPQEPKLKDPSDFTLIGNPDTSRRDNGLKTDGSAIYAMDVQLDNQLVVVIKRSPRFGGKVKAVDQSGAKNVRGFVRAAALPNGAGVAVFADNTWAAIQAREAVAVDWDLSAAETRSSDQIKTDLLKAVNGEPQFIGETNSTRDATQAALANAAQIVESEFYFPYLAHAVMEPLGCTIEPTAEGGVVLHDGCQFHTAAHGALSQALKLPFEKVQINSLYVGGSFGRRATTDVDYQLEAALAFAITDRTRPVKLVYTREDDLSAGYYRPAMAHKVRVGLDNDGHIVAWDHRIAGQSIFKGTLFEAGSVKNGVDQASVEGVPDTPYSIPGQFVGVTDMESPITIAWLRSVGNNHTGFVMESMMDMVAKAAGEDPVDYRLRYLPGDTPEQKRLRGVLELAAEKSGWGKRPKRGHTRGIAVHVTFGTYVAQVAEVSRNSSGAYTIEKVTCAVDCGLAVNPDIVKAQMEGGLGYGMGLVMRNEITLEEGEVVPQNFPDYEPLRISDIGAIDVHILETTDTLSGVAEPGLPPAGPALANAIAVDGPRVTMLPLASNGVEFA